MVPPCLFAFPPLLVSLGSFYMNISPVLHLERNTLNLKRWQGVDYMHVNMVGLSQHPVTALPRFFAGALE